MKKIISNPNPARSSMASSTGIGKKLNRWIQNKMALTDKNWNRYASGFPLLYKTSHFMNKPILGPLGRKLAWLENLETRYTQGHVVPINVDLNFRQQYKDMVLPVDLVRKAIKESSHRVILNECICRRGMKCTDYPIELGCIFLGEATRDMAARGICRDATVDEALEHLEWAVSLKLVAHSVWVEIESWFMGIKPENHHKLMEICLCCPCCCVGLQNYKKLGPEFMKRFDSVGWKPMANEDCVGCGKCAKVCPVEAITVGEKSVTIADNCIGCGICATNCPKKCIEMVQTAPTKERLQDYYWGFTPDIG